MGVWLSKEEAVEKDESSLKLKVRLNSSQIHLGEYLSRNMSATQDRSFQVEPKAEWEIPVRSLQLEAQF